MTATPPRWAAPLSSTLCLLGLLDSGYLTYEHYTGSATLACPGNGLINCHAVTTSAYSLLLGAPVAVLGMAYFAAMTLLCLPPAWRSSRPTSRLRLAGAVLGVLMVLYLLWAELFELDHICLWCTIVHLLMVLLFIVIVLAHALTESTLTESTQTEPDGPTWASPKS